MKFTKIITAYANLLIRRPGTVLVAVLLFAVVAGYGATKLRINTNQLDLISPKLKEVKDIRRIIDMIGGAGYLMVGVRGKDPKINKQVVNDFVKFLEADRKAKKHVRTFRYKVDQEFVRNHAPLFVKTDDLKKIRKHSMHFIKDYLKRKDPFFFEIEPTKPVSEKDTRAKIEPIINKYLNIGKKSIVDDYYISNDKKMLTVAIKPLWDGARLEKTGAFVAKIREFFNNYKTNGVSLKEDYNGKVDANPKSVHYGFTGSYKLNYDDSFSIQNSLIPTSGFALLGILLSMLLFFRRHVGAIFLVLSGLILGVIYTFGFARATVGELNMITSILAGILMGQGIDFGIHFIYRIREELGNEQSLEDAIRTSVVQAGTASFVSALALGAAFFALLFSEFRGFSQFGFLAGFGVIIIGTVIYAWAPCLLLVIGRKWPELPKKMVGEIKLGDQKELKERRIPKPGLILTVAAVIVVALSALAPKVSFNYDSRALMVDNQPSVRLSDEINKRFNISADPVAIWTPNLKANRKLHEFMRSKDPKAKVLAVDSRRFPSVDQAVGPYTFVPPMDRQKRNYEILKSWRKELEPYDKKLKPSMIPPKQRHLYTRWYKKIKQLLKELKPYTLKDVPPMYVHLFTHIKTAKPKNHGYLVFIYPKVDLWNGKNVLKFADELGSIKLKDGTEFRAAGFPIIMARLARIVLKDARVAVSLTALFLLIVLLVDFRSISATMLALVPLLLGVGVMLGVMVLLKQNLNFMNIVVFPIVLGYGISHGVYFMHRFLEGTSPWVALRSVGVAVACSTLTTLAGWSALLSAAHNGLKSMGVLACIGMSASLLVTFTVMPALLQIMHDRRTAPPAEAGDSSAA